MDGECVTDEPSEGSKPKTLYQLFRDIFPSYQAMGMSYDEFWNGPVWLAKSYRESYEMRMKNDEWARHRQGMYVLQALKVALSGFSKNKADTESYPERPWPLTEKEAKEQEKQEARDRYYRMRDKLMMEARQARQKKEAGGD